MRTILHATVGTDGRLLLGTALAERSRKLGLANADVEALSPAVDACPAEPLRFE